MDLLPRPVALALCLLLAACGDDGAGGHDGGGHDAHLGPHGGELAVVGDGVATLEVILDHGAEKIVLHVLTPDRAARPIAAAPVLTLEFADGPKTLTGVAVGGEGGESSEWHFRDPALAGEPEGGRFVIELDGETHEVAYEHDPHHGHAHAHDEGEEDDHGHEEDGGDGDHAHEEDG